MAKCMRCGQKVNIFSTRHQECEDKYRSGMAEYLSVVSKWVLAPIDVTLLRARLTEIRHRSFLTEDDENALLIRGWIAGAEVALGDNLLTKDEEQSLATAKSELLLTQQDLTSNDTNQTSAYFRVIKAAFLRDLIEGKPPKKIVVDGDLPFVLQKGEILYWLFPDTTYCEQRMRTHFEGGSSGISFRVAKGVYYRAGGFRGHSVSTSEIVTIGRGTLGITDKNIYFNCPAKTFRVKYDKIISFTPYSDGIGIQRDAQTAKPQVFITGDGWFLYNLVRNLAKPLDD